MGSAQGAGSRLIFKPYKNQSAKLLAVKKKIKT